MDRKNTILLTVIAVATLLVAVVGATFAYYSVVSTNSASTTKFTATGNPVGTITLMSPNTQLAMTLTPTDFAKFSESKKYYALITGDESQAPETSNGKYGTEKKNYTMTKASLVGGNNETAYTCTADLVVTLTKDEGTMGSVLEKGDAILYFTTDQTTIDGEETQTLDLSDIKETGSKTYSIIYKLNGKDDETRTAEIKADLEINNDVNKEQNYLAGSSKEDGQGTLGSILTVTITSPKINCTIDQEKAN